MNNIDIIETLNEMSKNEHEKFNAFRERLVKFCIAEKGVFHLFRILKNIEIELNDCLNGRIHVEVERAIVVKVLKTIKIELEIIRLKMKNPELIKISCAEAPMPAGEWTDDKVQLVELIYAIHKTRSVNHGNITLKALQDSFEYIFQVKLGNISDKLREINERKGTKIRYLELLIKNLNNLLHQLK